MKTRLAMFVVIVLELSTAARAGYFLVHTISSPSQHTEAAVGSWLCSPQP
jgi:hypothetical protein